jgi:hypothetical protein
MKAIGVKKGRMYFKRFVVLAKSNTLPLYDLRLLICLSNRTTRSLIMLNINEENSCKFGRLIF